MALPNQGRGGRRSKLPPGTSMLGLATLVGAASFSLTLRTANAIYCDRLAPLAVLAALAATLIALCFRALAAARSRGLFYASLLLASVALFVSARFIARYHAACAGVEQQLRQLHHAQVPGACSMPNSPTDSFPMHAFCNLPLVHKYRSDLPAQLC